MPSYKCWETPFYGVGLKVYDALAGKAGLGSTEFLNLRQAQSCIPGVRAQGLKGGVKYWDGQFDDARLALALARTAAAQGALLINYCPVTQLIHEQGRSEEHTSELQSLMRNSYAVFCLQKQHENKHNQST